MEDSILRKLYNGEIYPAEQINPNSPKYREITGELEKVKKRFVETLNDSNIELFNRIEELRGEIANIYGFEDFACGFRLAVSLIFEGRNVDEIINGKE
jgi:hypothetical protein